MLENEVDDAYRHDFVFWEDVTEILNIEGPAIKTPKEWKQVY